MFFKPVVSTTTLGSADMYPIGRFVAGSGKSTFLDECLNSSRTILVALLTIIRYSFADHRQGLEAKLFEYTHGNIKNLALLRIRSE